MHDSSSKINNCFSKDLYDSINQKPELAKMAGKFCGNLIPGYPPFIVYLVLTKYLQTQHILTPSVVVGFVSNLFNAVVNYLLIYHWGLGFEGAPIATSIARWFQMFLLLGYVYFSYPTHAKTWPAFQMPHNFRKKAAEFLHLGIPGALMFGLEAWAFEASTLMATYLDTVSLDAHTILLNTCAFTFVSLAFALGVVGSIRVGHLLGSNNGAGAKLSTRVLLVLVVVVQAALAVFYATARNYIGMIYSNDAEVIAKVATLSHIAGIFQVCDGIAAYVGGILKGMGHQLISAGLNLVGFWIIGTMLGGVLTFECSWGVSGIWWGLCAGLFAASVIGMFIISRIDFEKEAARAQKRVAAVHSDDDDGAASCQVQGGDCDAYDGTDDNGDGDDNTDDDIELMKNIITSSS
jgi:multidrug resistance protein, MATE family